MVFPDFYRQQSYGNYKTMKKSSALYQLLLISLTASIISCNHSDRLANKEKSPVTGYHDRVLIHSHNDYQHAVPFRDAYFHHVADIEADVYLPRTPKMGDSLMIGHDTSDVKPGKTLISMYIDPIVSLFKKYGNRVSPDPNYTFRLMIDAKDQWKGVYPLLLKEVNKYPSVFDRKINPMAVQVFVSGNRPPDSTFHTYPDIINFDGLPGHNYAPADLKKVVLISDNFATYSDWNGEGELSARDLNKIKKVIAQAHRLDKPFRFWGTPDTANVWEQLRLAGADMINTDKIADCTQYFNSFYK
jgi:alkaline phosphatase